MVDKSMGGSAISEARFERAEGARAPLARAPLIEARGLHKEYVTGRGRLELFRGLDFTVYPGEMVAIVGSSGAGKSTLLHILGALDAPTSGDLYFGSLPLSRFDASQAADFRNREVGYVWQFHYLLPEFSALENVAMPLLARGERRHASEKKALQWLEEVGLADRAEHRSGELSGGEQQRVALARALITGPRLLLADEPTGDLDEGTADRVFRMIARLHASHGLTSILVTHNQELAARCSRILRLEGGRMVEDRTISGTVQDGRSSPGTEGASRAAGGGAGLP